MSDLPITTVTFLFTDIEGSTTLWEKFPAEMHSVLSRHDVLSRQAVESNRGKIVKMRGDGIHAVFGSARDALEAALGIHRALRDEAWGEIGTLRMRIGLHTGAVEERGGDYYGPTVNRAARLMSAANGGQILLSFATRELVRDDLPAGVTLRELGMRRLKDLTQPERIFQVLATDLPDNLLALHTLDAEPNNLPIQLTLLIDREAQVSLLQSILRSNVRLITLIGVGGTGKTRLGLQVAAEVLEDFPDGVFFVNLAPLGDPNLIASTIAQTLGLRESGSESFDDALKSYLRDKKMLLALDNFEQIIDAAPVVAELLITCPRVKILVTSREALRVQGEQEFLVPPLDIPDLGHAPTLAQISNAASVTLFVQRVQALDPSFALTEENAYVIASICVRLEGLPLAIELAAARCKVLSPQMILSRLSERFTLLTSGTRDMPPRHQTLRKAVAWSYDLLNEHEKTLFRRLSVFAGGCSLEAAEAICEMQDVAKCSVMDNLASLVDKSLVRRDDTNQNALRFTMLETIREYAHQKLIESGETDHVRGRHLQFYLELAKRAETYLHGSDQLAWLNVLGLEHYNLRAALDFAAGAKAWETGLQLAGTLWWFWYVRGYLSEGRARLEQMLKAELPDVFEPPTNPAYAKGLYGVASLAWRQGDYHHAGIWSAQSKAICQTLGDQLGLAWSFYNQGLIAQFQSDFGQATVMFEQSLAHFKESNNTHGIAMALNGLGDVMYSQGDFDQAAEMFEESLGLLTESGDYWGIAHTRSLLGVTQIRRGRVSEASDFLNNSLSLFRELGEKSGLAYTLDNLGGVAELEGDYPLAINLVEEGLRLRREVGNQRGIAASLGHLGRIVSTQGDLERAIALYKESLTLLKILGDKLAIALLVTNIGALAIRQGQFVRAAQLLSAAATLRQIIGASWSEAEAEEFLAYRDWLQSSLDGVEFVRAWNQGSTMNIEQAVAYALQEAQ